MKKNVRFLLLLAICGFGLSTMPARAGEELNAVECIKSASFLASMDSSDRLKYAPDRDVEVLHLALDITPDFKQRTMTGKATLRFKPLLNPIQEIKLDAVELEIDSVTSTEKIQGYQVTDEHVIVTFAEPIAAGSEASVTVTYHAEPTQGIYFRTPEMGYKEGDTHLFTQGEEIEARHWYPCFDSPNEKFTSELTCRVPVGMTVVSNGRLMSEEKDRATGLMVVHWSQEKPHANYLVTLVAGNFKRLEGKHNDVPLAFLTPPSEIREAGNSFRDTEEIMAFFEKEIGVAYPWAKYYQVCVNDFVAGGMENTSATTLTDSTLFTEATENLHNSESLVSHEMAHQWFGDLVTCKDWSHIWLNEGAATYYAMLYDGHKNGRDSMLYALYQNARQITSMPNDTNSIVRRNFDAPRDMFGYLAYPKGGWVLYMLRSQLGEELYRKCIKTYLERHQYGNVVTEDLRAVIEELTGQSYDQFFDQWLFHAHQPELEISQGWDEKTKLAKVTIRQVQKVSDSVLLFNFPLTVRFKGIFGTKDQVIQVKEKDETFYFPLESAPKLVRIDPNYTLLAKISFDVPNSMLTAQLADKDDVIGRLLAIEQLGSRKDKDAITKLKGALNNDPFFGVRLEAAGALRLNHSDEALEALLASTKQSDARVRRAVITDLGGFYRNTAYDSERAVLEQEKNPEILASAIRDLGSYAKPEVHDILLKYLTSESYHNALADAAIGSMRSQDDPVYIAPLLETLSKHEADFTSRGFGQGLGTLAYLARNEDKKGDVREFLAGSLNHKNKRIQLAAMEALRTLGDPKAIAVLETFATASKESQERVTAERALTDLRAARKPVDDFKNLRQEVLDLEKANRDLHKELDDLKKRIEAKDIITTSAQPRKRPLILAPKDRADAR
ncbi:MAG: putative rane alanyl aminopeptidase [Pedosphaera sp.]|nr:putative rane alanyl aminopeptidase [Pedosphaera sp.]